MCLLPSLFIDPSCTRDSHHSCCYLFLTRCLYLFIYYSLSFVCSSAVNISRFFLQLIPSLFYMCFKKKANHKVAAFDPDDSFIHSLVDVTVCFSSLSYRSFTWTSMLKSIELWSVSPCWTSPSCLHCRSLFQASLFSLMVFFFKACLFHCLSDLNIIFLALLLNSLQPISPLVSYLLEEILQQILGHRHIQTNAVSSCSFKGFIFGVI